MGFIYKQWMICLTAIIVHRGWFYLNGYFNTLIRFYFNTFSLKIGCSKTNPLYYSMKDCNWKGLCAGGKIPSISLHTALRNNNNNKNRFFGFIDVLFKKKCKSTVCMMLKKIYWKWKNNTLTFIMMWRTKIPPLYDVIHSYRLN